MKKETLFSQRIISWFSCGAASAVATKLALQKYKKVLPVYCDTGAEHPDSKRFMADCEDWMGVKVKILQSKKFTSTWAVWEKYRFLASVRGAACTKELKVMPRQGFERIDDIQIFGYTANKSDIARANRFSDHFFEINTEFPLIEKKLTKAACLAIIEDAGITLPVLYKLGFHNNNCIPCVKATSPNYWALIRQEFPKEFDRMGRLSRELGVRLCQIKGKRIFIDEIPPEQPTTEAIVPACDFLCTIAAKDLDNEK